jgi:hypothetical protein
VPTIKPRMWVFGVDFIVAVDTFIDAIWAKSNLCVYDDILVYLMSTITYDCAATTTIKCPSAVGRQPNFVLSMIFTNDVNAL